jgi:hypothetical protein
VKSRLQRGLQRLRARLDERQKGGREAWCAVAIALAGRGVPLAKVSALVMPAVAAVLLVGAALWTARAIRSRSEDANSHGTRAAAGGAVRSVNDGSALASRAPLADDPEATQRERELAAGGALPFASGVVVDEHDAPLAGVRVVTGTLQHFDEQRSLDPLDDGSIESRTLARTDVAGRFAVAAPPPPDLAVLYFVRDGFQPAVVDDLAREPAANQGRRVALRAGVPFHAEFVDTDGQPVDDALALVTIGEYRRETRVARLQAGEPEYSANYSIPQWWHVADERGTFTASVDAKSRIRVWPMSAGYWTGWDRDFAPDEVARFVFRRHSIVLDVTAAESGAPIDDASVYVLDAETHAVVAVKSHVVLVQKSNAPRIVQSLHAGRLGVSIGDEEFDKAVPAWIHRLDGRTLALTVIAPHRRSATTTIRFHRQEEPPHLAIALEAGDDPPSIRGAVRGAPEASVTIAWAPPQTSGLGYGSLTTVRTVTTGADGGFVASGLPDGDYRITATAPGRTPATIDVTAPCSDVALELVPSATLVVRVVDPDGAPVPGSAVHVETAAQDHAWMKRCDESGVVRFEEMPATTILAAAGESFLYDAVDNVPHPLGDPCFEPGDVQQLAPGETKELTLVAPRRIPVRLRVVDEDGRPLAHTDLQASVLRGAVGRIKMAKREPMQETLTTDGGGRAELSWWPGTYMLAFARDGLLCHREGIEIREPGVAGAACEVVWTIPTRERLGTLRGRVVDASSDAPLAGCSIILVLLRDGEQVACSDWGSFYAAPPRSIRTDADGAFAIDGVPIGPASISCYSGDPHAPITGEETFATTQRGCTIVAGEQTIAIRVVRTEPAADATDVVRIRIHAVDAATQTPLKDVYAILEGLQGETTYQLGFLKTDSRGTIEHLSPAFPRYRIRTSGPCITSPPVGATHDRWTAEVVPVDRLVDVRCELKRLPPGRRR